MRESRLKTTKYKQLAILFFAALFFSGASFADVYRVSPLEQEVNRAPQMASQLKEANPPRLSARALNTTASECNLSSFYFLNGNALKEKVKSTRVSCLEELYSIDGTTGAKIFSQAQMLSITNEIQDLSAGYDLSDEKINTMLRLVTFLRAGYYVQFYNSAAVGSYDNTLAQASEQALTAFYQTPHFFSDDYYHAQLVSEYITLFDSSAQNHTMLFVVEALLNHASNTPNYLNNYYTEKALNNTFTVLFKVHSNDSFKTSANLSTPSIVASLKNFISQNKGWIGTSKEYLIVNASNELGRFLQYQHNDIKNDIQNLMQTLSGGINNPAWIALADQASFYDKNNCQHYNTCTYKTDLESSILPINEVCNNGHLIVRAQSLTAEQIAYACNQLKDEQEFFHQVLNTGGVPVDHDYNESLELVIFASSKDYKKYAGSLFNISTDNGGMYLEGNPERPDNQARFIAYVAEWVTNDFEIWNLHHEYNHYLDGRYNKYGVGNWYYEKGWQEVKDVWWVEGLAEYIAYTFRNKRFDSALNAAKANKIPLSVIFQNDYNAGQDRIYYWGYLAVRYMFEQHREQVDQILEYFRSTDEFSLKYYEQYMQQIGTSHDAHWEQWLDCYIAGQGNTDACNGTIQEDNIDDNTTPEDSTDDETVAENTADDDTTQTDNTDDNTDDDTIPVVDIEPTPCTISNKSVLSTHCNRSGIQGNSKEELYFYLKIESDKPITLTLEGPGNLPDLYIQEGNWPSHCVYDMQSEKQGSKKTLRYTPSQKNGYAYIALHSANDFKNVSIKATH